MGHLADVRSKVLACLTGKQTPLPVAAIRAGGVHAAALAERQPVLHLRNEEPAAAAHAAADDTADEALFLIQTQVFFRKRELRRSCLRAPEGEGRVSCVPV